MLKDKLKGFASGVIVSTLFAGTVAYAATGGNMIEVFYNVNNIKIDKVSKMPTDDKPFIYNGSTYVPLRFVAENLGKKVGWDGNTGTVLIGEVEGPNDEYLGERVQPMSTKGVSIYGDSIYLAYQGKKILDNLSNEYENYISFIVGSHGLSEGQSMYQDYPLNGQFSTFTAKLGLRKDYQNSNNILKFAIEGDGKELYSREIKAGDFPDDVSVSVKGVNKLTFKVTLKVDGLGDSGIGLFNPILAK